MTPALLTRMPISSPSACAALTTAAGAGRLGEVLGDHADVDVVLALELGGELRAAWRVAGDQRQAVAVPGELARQLGADARPTRR